MSIKSPEEYRADARRVRVLAEQANDEDASNSLLGMANLLEYLARRAESSTDASPLDDRQTSSSRAQASPDVNPHPTSRACGRRQSV